MIRLSVKDNDIYIDKIDIDTETAEKIMKICHKYKHLYLDGFPHGRNTRKKLAGTGAVFNKWENSPHVCITYVFKKANEKVIINAIIANRQDVSRIYTDEELQLFLQQWQQDVLESLEETFN